MIYTILKVVVGVALFSFASTAIKTFVLGHKKPMDRVDEKLKNAKKEQSTEKQ